jgi:hypothetical protein
LQSLFPFFIYIIHGLNWKNNSPTLKLQEAYALFLLGKETLVCKQKSGILRNLAYHPTEKHELDQIAPTSNEITCLNKLKLFGAPLCKKQWFLKMLSKRKEKITKERVARH